ncbi:hypothetical protein NAP1_04300 [Erythrobacter sp. NAP1]|nr:hypothetical protein NAP1_04300 [Erythrobacter sp. NAP1]
MSLPACFGLIFNLDAISPLESIDIARFQL